MQDITVLELQIAKELEELDRIQGVLKTMGQSEEGYPENPLKVVSKQARKSPVPRRKNNKIQESVENEKNDYDSLHEFIMLEREQELMSKDESSKSKMNLKPKNDRNLQNRNLNLPPRSSLAKIKPTTQLDEERIDPDFSKLVLSSKHNRDKSVADIGHEEYEKMCQKFREARMNTKNFDERVRLLMIEVRWYDIEREQGADERSDQKS